MNRRCRRLTGCFVLLRAVASFVVSCLSALQVLTELQLILVEVFGKNVEPNCLAC